MIGETYQVDGGLQNAFCRSKRILAVSECYSSVCRPPVCLEEGNYYEFYTYGADFGLMAAELANPPTRFICEEP